jgi:hypothetical protein
LKKNALLHGNRREKTNVSRGHSFSSSIDFHALSSAPGRAGFPVGRKSGKLSFLAVCPAWKDGHVR